ncbi:MAG: HIT domain-containing protein [Spirochaetia bacterium]
MTIFEKMLSKEITVQPIYEDESVLVIQDIDAQSPCHLLLIPKESATSLNDILDWSDEQAGRYFKSTAKVAQALGLSKNGYRVVINTGEHGGQTVTYLHMHLLGGRRMSWPPG